MRQEQQKTGEVVESYKKKEHFTGKLVYCESSWLGMKRGNLDQSFTSKNGTNGSAHGHKVYCIRMVNSQFQGIYGFHYLQSR